MREREGLTHLGSSNTRYGFDYDPSLLEAISNRWNITLFHYRNHGADHGKVLVGMQIPHKERAEANKVFKTLGYAFRDVSKNPAYRLFLGNKG